MKKLLLFTFLFLFALQSMAFAAVSGSKGSSAPRPSAPSVSQPSTPSAPAPAAPSSPSTAPGYKPSAPASSYSDKAPAAAAKPQQPAQQQSTGSSFLRNAAMIGGGMLLGSMLGNMFGFGANGMFAEIIGVLFNLMLVFLVVFGIRYAWNRYRASKEEKENKDRAALR